ncbi:MAG: DUF87 domain-containing protein [Candidatus Margulisbacteria bacterium]|nr:DUF87 domain-containing protein [Candidatus Margulisiibacteriota bacterium]
MSKIKSFLYLAIFFVALIALRYFITIAFPHLPKDSDIWFASGLLLIILGIFITEKYFTKSLDVIVNIITLLIVLWTVDSFKTFALYPSLLVYTIIVGFMAIASFLIYDNEKDPQSWHQRVANSLNKVSTFLGSSRILFSIVFILSFFNYIVFSMERSQSITTQQIAAFNMIVFWGAVILIEPIDNHIIQPIINIFHKKAHSLLIARIIGHLTPNIVIAEQSSGSFPKYTTGDLFIVDKYNPLHGDIWAMYIDELDADNKRYLQFYIIKGSINDIAKETYVFIPSPNKNTEMIKFLSDSYIFNKKTALIGTVYDNSDINVIKIRMIPGIDLKYNLEEGDLINVELYGDSAKYQIINVKTDSEIIDGKSKKGIKIITAQQIGFWDDKQQFIDANWVPDLNSLVFLEDPNTKDIPELGVNYYRIGLIPKSKYPVYINFDDSITHHVAIIGKTGTGKSRMAANIIEKLANNGYKIVLLEIDQNNPQSLSKYISPSLITSEKFKWSCKQEKRRERGHEIDYDVWKCETNFSPEDKKNIFLVNWENKSQTTENGPLSQTDGAVAVIENVIRYQIKDPKQKICIVMEEAYDFIPESTFGQQEFGQPKVSRISQLALKCRKHNIGFLIITQRTALVTKTILYQCHTIIALQTFDETSKHFMSAYINNKYLESMSILPRFRAIVVGKGSTCDKPVIVDFYDKSLSKPSK